MGIFPSTYFEGKRITSATAHLPNAPENLVVLTESTVTRVIFDGKRAVGVELENGRRGMFTNSARHVCLQLTRAK